jgi:hypothetical protein
MGARLWEQDYGSNRNQPGMRQVNNQGTWTATLATPASTPEPGTALGLMVIGLWAWQGRSQQTTQDSSPPTKGDRHSHDRPLLITTKVDHNQS